jgi:hypothetical protein
MCFVPEVCSRVMVFNVVQYAIEVVQQSPPSQQWEKRRSRRSCLIIVLVLLHVSRIVQYCSLDRTNRINQSINQSINESGGRILNLGGTHKVIPWVGLRYRYNN